MVHDPMNIQSLPIDPKESPTWRSLASCLAPFSGLAAWCMDANLAGNTRCSFGTNDTGESGNWQRLHVNFTRHEMKCNIIFKKASLFGGFSGNSSLIFLFGQFSQQSWKVPNLKKFVLISDMQCLHLLTWFLWLFWKCCYTDFQIIRNVFVFAGMILQTLLDNACKRCIE